MSNLGTYARLPRCTASVTVPAWGFGALRFAALAVGALMLVPPLAPFLSFEPFWMIVSLVAELAIGTALLLAVAWLARGHTRIELDARGITVSRWLGSLCWYRVHRPRRVVALRVRPFRSEWPSLASLAILEACLEHTDPAVVSVGPPSLLLARAEQLRAGEPGLSVVVGDSLAVVRAILRILALATEPRAPGAPQPVRPQANAGFDIRLIVNAFGLLVVWAAIVLHWLSAPGGLADLIALLMMCGAPYVMCALALWHLSRRR